MEDISSYYRELSILQLKYEHLAETCRVLLKTWPSPTESVEDERKKKLSEKPLLQACSTEQGHDAEVCSEELAQLNALLNKAQRIRTHKPEEKLSKKSTKVTSEVYRNGKVFSYNTGIITFYLIGQDESKVVTRKARSNPGIKKTGFKLKLEQTGSSSRLEPAGPKPGPGLRSRSESSIHKKQSTGACCHHMTVSQAQASSTSSLHHQGTNWKTSDDQVQDGKKLEAKGFSIIQNGAQLSMPSKYYKLQESISRCSEALVGNATAETAATHFAKRLFSKSSTNSKLIELRLAMEEISILKEKLLSMTLQEWPISERSSWQEILYLKTKVDLLMECYHMILDSDRRVHETSRCDRDGLKLKLDDSPNVEFAYSSLRDWIRLSSLMLQKKHKLWEKHYLTDVKDTLIPRVCQYIEEACSKGNKNAAVSMLQALYLASDIHTKPVYLNMEEKQFN